MSTGTGAPKRGSGTGADGRRSIAEFFGTLPGILTALATLITAIGGAFFGGTQVTAHTATQPTATVTVTIPAQAGTMTASGTPSQPGGNSLPTGTTYLAALTPVASSMDPTTGAQKIGTTTYPDSIRITCGYTGHDSLVYEVAGYKTLNATIGVPSNATNAAGKTAHITFLKDGTTTQLAPGVTTALGQPQTVHVNLQGASQLAIGCATSELWNIDIALGSATLSSS